MKVFCCIYFKETQGKLQRVSKIGLTQYGTQYCTCTCTVLFQHFNIGNTILPRIGIGIARRGYCALAGMHQLRNPRFGREGGLTSPGQQFRKLLHTFEELLNVTFRCTRAQSLRFSQIFSNSFVFIKPHFILITKAPSAGQQLRNLVHTSDQNFQLHTIRSIFKLLNATFHHFIIIMNCCQVFNHIADLLQLNPPRQLL